MYSPELAPELLELSKKNFRWNLEKFRADGPYIKSNIFLVSGRIAFDHFNFLQNYACTLQNWRQNYWNSQKKNFRRNLEKFRADGPYIKSNIFLVSGRIAFDHYNFLQNYECTLQNWRQNYWNSQKKILY